MLAGYCWPQSVSPGEITSVYCHGGVAQVQLQVVRKGAADIVVHEQTIQVLEQELSDELSVRGCDWKMSAEISVDQAWPSGFYLVRFIAEDDEVAEAYFVVRATEPQDALLVLSTSTWAAYNDWGGPSFYTGGNTSALRRPLPKGFLDKDDPQRFRIARFIDWDRDEGRAFARKGYSQWSMAAGWANWEILFVRWAEARGYNLGYATSFDLDQDPDLLAGYSAYVSIGHDEYWSVGMRDNVEGYIDSGGNAAFFSGNTSFWQARFEGNGTQLVAYKTALTDDPDYDADGAPKLSTMWSDPLVGRPESEMTGVSFTRGGYAHMPNAPRGSGGYTVWQPRHWAFESLNFSEGDQLGASAIVVAYECDGCELEYVEGKPFARLSSAAEPTIPPGLEVLGTAPARLWETHQASGELHESYIGELNWVAERLAGEDTEANRRKFADGHAVLGSFSRGAGQVFTAGCTDWAYGLEQRDVATVTDNVLKRFTSKGS
ncbi:MAG: hypothetical protein GKR90_09875 [Pseudomonadales bacterium]|nr:hypothetical protein [Pseudomonadales bacterium]